MSVSELASGTGDTPGALDPIIALLSNVLNERISPAIAAFSSIRTCKRVGNRCSEASATVR